MGGSQQDPPPTLKVTTPADKWVDSDPAGAINMRTAWRFSDFTIYLYEARDGPSRGTCWAQPQHPAATPGGIPA